MLKWWFFSQRAQAVSLRRRRDLQEVHSALKDALRLGALSFDAVKHLVLCRLEGRPPRLDMELYPYLPRVRVSTTSTQDYMALLTRAGGMNDRSTLLLEHHLKELKLPSFLREYGKMAAQCAAENVDHPSTCSGSRNWSSSTATSAWWSGGSAPPDSPR